jgi:hypothetical protein
MSPIAQVAPKSFKAPVAPRQASEKPAAAGLTRCFPSADKLNLSRSASVWDSERSDARAAQWLDQAIALDSRRDVKGAEQAFMTASRLSETPKQALEIADAAAERSYVPAADLAFKQAGRLARTAPEALGVAEEAAVFNYIQGAHEAYMRAVGLARTAAEAKTIERSADRTGYPKAALAAAERVRQLP